MNNHILKLMKKIYLHYPLVEILPKILKVTLLTITLI
jgi:hypothetical protein